MSEEKNTYVVLRLSSLGNVAMLVPVMNQLSQTYPNDEFVVMSLKPLADLFYGLKNVRFVEVAPELEHSHKLCSLAKQIKALNPAKVFDLQNDFRTRVVRYVLHFYAIPTCTIDLGTRERRALSRAGFEKSTPLKPEVERYADTFRSGGLIPAGEVPLMKVNTQAAEKVQALFGKKTERWIGIAPFAKHLSNVLPYKTMKDVIGYYAQQPNTRIFLFGAGHVETEMLRQWASLWDNVESVTNQLPLDGELELMRQTDALLCMDSANQHLAALVGCPTLSIWCGTHTYMGFAAWGKANTQILSLPVSCRPCSIHGTERCRYRNFACKALSPELIIERFNKLLTIETKQ